MKTHLHKLFRQLDENGFKTNHVYLTKISHLILRSFVSAELIAFDKQWALQGLHKQMSVCLDTFKMSFCPPNAITSNINICSCFQWLVLWTKTHQKKLRI